MKKYLYDCIILYVFEIFLLICFIVLKYICIIEYVYVFGIWNLLCLVINIKGFIESKCDVLELMLCFVCLLGE